MVTVDRDAMQHISPRVGIVAGVAQPLQEVSTLISGIMGIEIALVDFNATTVGEATLTGSLA